jgi:hypothetical protein
MRAFVVSLDLLRVSEPADVLPEAGSFGPIVAEHPRVR